MTDCRNNTINGMLEDLQAQLLSCEDAEERVSLRAAIKHLRITQDLLNPASNLRRSRRNRAKKDKPPVSSTSESDSIIKHIVEKDIQGQFQNDKCQSNTTPDVTSSKLGEEESDKETEVCNKEEELVISDVQSKEATLFEAHHSVQQSVPAGEPAAESTKKGTRSRSPFPHLLKLKSSKNSSKESDPKSPSLVSDSAPTEEKGLTGVKRRFSGQFRKRSKVASQSNPTSPEEINSLEPDYNPPTSPELPNSFEPEAAPARDPREGPSRKKSVTQEHRTQKKRSVRVIRRAINRFFTPKQKHAPSGEASENRNPFEHIPLSEPELVNPPTSETSCEPTTSEQDPALNSITPVEEMAQVVTQPLDVALAPNQIDSKMDDDVTSQRLPVLEDSLKENQEQSENNNNNKSELVASQEAERTAGLKETSVHVNELPVVEEKKSPITTRKSSPTPPWAPNINKKSSFRSVSFVTPQSRQPPKTSTSTPFSVEPNLLKETPFVTPTTLSDSAPLTTETPFVTPTTLSDSAPLTTETPRLGNLGGSFRTHRPTYKLPQHFKTRAESFRLHRPKDFIKQSSEASGDRAIFNPVSKVSKDSNLTPLSSDQDQFSTHFRTDIFQISRSSLKRSESCKENRSSQNPFPSIPVVQGNKRRSKGILSRILSVKIDSEKANQHLQTSQTLPISSPSTDNSSETKKSPLVKEKPNFSSKSYLGTVTSPSPSDTDSASKDEKNEEVLETAEPTKHEKIEEIVHETVEPQPDLAEIHPVVNDEQLSNELYIEPTGLVKALTTSPKCSHVDLLDAEVSLLLDKVVGEVAANFERKISKPCLPENDLIESIVKPTSPRLCSVASPIAQTPSKTIFNENLAGSISESRDTPSPELIVEQFLEDNNDTFDSSFSDSCGSDFEGDMEGRYSLRSRRIGGVGSVKSRIIATENRKGNAESDVKKERRVLETRALRNVEGVRSRMNKFSAMAATTPTAAKTNFSRKKEATPPSDVNNNLNGEMSVLKKEKAVKEVRKTPVKCSSGFLNDVQSPADCDKAAELKVDKKPDNLTGTVPHDAVAVKGKPLVNGNLTPNLTTPPVMETNGEILPLSGDKEDAIESGTVETKLQNGQSRDDDALKQHNIVNEMSSTSDVKAKTSADAVIKSTSPAREAIESRGNDVSKEKVARRERRRASNRSEDSAKPRSPVARSPEKNHEIPSENQEPLDPIIAVEVTSKREAGRRRRRARRSPESAKSSTSGSAASTPDGDTNKLVAVEIPGVDSVQCASSTSPVDSVASPTSPRTLPDNFSSSVTSSAQTNLEKKAESPEAKGDVINTEPANSVIQAINDQTTQNKEEKNKEENSNDAERLSTRNTKTDTKTDIDAKLSEQQATEDRSVEMAPQTQNAITLHNINQCQDEATLKKMLEQATDYEDRKRIRGALRVLRKKQSDANSPRSPLSPALTVTNSSSHPAGIIRTAVNFEERWSSKTTVNHTSHTEKFSVRATSIRSEMTTNKKVGSIFDRDDDVLKKSLSRVNHVERKREIVRNRSMPSSSAKDARRLFVAKLEGESGGKTGSKKVGRSPTFVVPNANNVKQLLLKWCQSKTRGYEHVDINNFSGSWANGMAFCALVHNFFPDSFDYSTLDPKNRAQNFELAFNTAEKLANADQLLEVEDMMIMGNRPDSKCVFTYVQSLYNKLRKFEKPLQPLTPTEQSSEEKEVAT